MGNLLGIDFGAVYTKAAVVGERTGKGFMTFGECRGVSLILDRAQRRGIPSVVARNEGGEIVAGMRAKAYIGTDPGPIVLVKRYLGEARLLPLAGGSGLWPEEAAAYILRYLRQLAEEQLDEPADTAVIAVPAYFSAPARRALEKAAELAGLRLLRLVPEPVAAALAYFAADPRDPLRILIYDLGGGKFEAAVVEKRGGAVELRAAEAEPLLGGGDFDGRLTDWLVERLERQGCDLRSQGSNASDMPAILARLRLHAEQARITLSHSESYAFLDTTLRLKDRLGNEVMLDEVIKRSEFEALIGARIEHTLAVCRRVIARVSPPISPEEIDEVVLSGGAAGTPLVVRRLEAEFGRPPRMVAADVCVALGAALTAAAAAAAGGVKVAARTLQRPLNLIVEGRRWCVAAAGTPLPHTAHLQLKTAAIGRGFRLPLLDADRLLGEIVVEDIPADLLAGSTVEIYLTVDENYRIASRVYVPAVNRQLSADFEIAASPPRSLEELRQAYVSLARQMRETLANAEVQARFAVEGRLRELQQEIERLFQMPAPEPAALEARLAEAERLTDSLGAEWEPEPSRAEFVEVFERVEALLARVIAQDPRLTRRDFGRRLDEVRAMAEKAYQARDEAGWEAANVKLLRIGDELLQSNPSALRAVLAHALETLAMRALAAGRHHDRYRQARERLGRIDVDAPDALLRLRDWYLKDYERLRRQLEPVMSVEGLLADLPDLDRTLWPISGAVEEIKGEEPAAAAGQIERLYFFVTASAGLRPGVCLRLGVWAQPAREGEMVLERAQQAAGSAGAPPGTASRRQGVEWSVQLSSNDLIVEEPETSLLWDDGCGGAYFSARVPNADPPQYVLGTAIIRAGGLQTARLYFDIPLGELKEAEILVPVTEKRHRRAFAACAPEDRETVLRRLQSLRRANPELEIFWSRQDAYGSEKWEQQLWKVMLASDVFYLFWSEHACRSEWIEREWRLALEEKGPEFIDPVPLVSPLETPPPAALLSQGLYDWDMAFRRWQRSG